MERFTGRPADLTWRTDPEKNTYDLLDRLAIPYERTDHAPAMTMEDCDAVDAVLGVRMCKNLFLCNRQQTKFYLLMMPGEKPFKTKELSHQLGIARLSFAPENYLWEYLDIHPGSVSVLGLANDRENHVQLLIDADLLCAEYTGCHPCVNTSSLRIRTRDLLEVFLPAVHHTPIPVVLTGEG